MVKMSHHSIIYSPTILFYAYYVKMSEGQFVAMAVRVTWEREHILFMAIILLVLTNKKIYLYYGKYQLANERRVSIKPLSICAGLFTAEGIQKSCNEGQMSHFHFLTKINIEIKKISSQFLFSDNDGTKHSEID